jgi:hypothetical protein
MTPTDVNNPQPSFRETITQLDVLIAMAAEDFRGDGQKEIVGLSISRTAG